MSNRDQYNALNGEDNGEYQHLFICGICGGHYYSDPLLDGACREEFISRYGHAPENTIDDELVSLCDVCNEEYERRRALTTPNSENLLTLQGNSVTI